MLQEQYRMHPEISRFPSTRFYRGRLVDVRGLSPGHGLPPYAVVDVASGTEEIYRRESQIINMREAQTLACFAKQLTAGLENRQKTPGSRCPPLVVITFYNGQAALIRQLLGPQAGVEVHTVDSFQGSEAEVVLLSFVRANANRRLGFLSEFRRLNVALTRAKHSLIVFANASLLKSVSSADDVAALFEDASARKLIWKEDQLKELLGLAAGSSTKTKRRQGSRKRAVPGGSGGQGWPGPKQPRTSAPAASPKELLARPGAQATLCPQAVFCHAQSSVY